jgi:ribosomal protein S8
LTDRLTIVEFKALKKKRPSKYRNEKTAYDGIVFDSKREAARYKDLRLMEKAGEISDLELQPVYQILMDGKKMAKYKADFRYREKGHTIVEDVKSEATKKNKVYRLKKKLVEAQFGIIILETE